jgi:hypothetical protein
MYVAGGMVRGLMNCGWAGGGVGGAEQVEVASVQLASNYGRKDPFMRRETFRENEERLMYLLAPKILLLNFSTPCM